MKRKNLHWLLILTFVIGGILFIDQLWMFGLPISSIFPDLSAWDITDSDAIHHWMVGVVMMITSIVIMRRRKMI